MLKCPECGGNLNYHFNQGNHDIKFFSCCNHNTGYRKCTSTHYIRLDFLEQVVLQEIRRLTQFADEYEDDFVKEIIGHSAKTAACERSLRQKELDSLLARDKELDTLFERLYEDNISGKINDERFAKMSKKCEQEQGENAAKVKALKSELRKAGGQLMTADNFLETIRRYTDARELSQRMVTELIDHIDVYHAEKVSGQTVQHITIFYNCIGAFTVPERESIPEADVRLKTRKGVALSYSQAKAG